MTDNNVVKADFFLTPEEYYRKRANIIEELKKCSIDIGYRDGFNCISEDKNNKKGTHYKINIQTPVDPCIPKKTAVYHELSHALWDSFVSGSIQILDEWSSETLRDLLKEKKIPHAYNQLGRIPVHISSEIAQAQEKMKSFIKSVYINCFNCLEDQRIESLTKNVWLATRGMFKQALTSCGQQMSTATMLTPSDHLLAPRFFRPELTTARYIQAVKDVEGTGMTGAVVVMTQIRDLIDAHIKENLDKTLDIMKKAIKHGSSLPIPPEEVNKYLEKVAVRTSTVGNVGSYESRIKKYENAVKGSSLTVEQKKEAQKKVRSYRSVAKKSKTPPAKTEKDKKLEAQAKKQAEHKLTTECLSTEMTKQTEQENHINGKCNTQISHEIGEASNKTKNTSMSLEESKKQAQREVSSILEKILVSGSPKEPAYIKLGIKREKEVVKPDNNIANLLARTFERVRHSKRTQLTERGNELDIEALIQSHSKGYGDYMIEEVRHKGLTIYVSIDGSGSMRYNSHMGEARTLVATMFKAVERVPSVKILANVWSSNTDGDVGITTIKSLSECKFISMSEETENGGYYYTPTHEAIRFTAKQMGNYSGKKLMIIITDGIPQYHKNNRSYSNDVLINMAQKEYRKAQRLCKNIMCINISHEARSKENLRQIFKRNYVEFNGMKQAKTFVLKNFRRTVFETLRK
jgi:hypothetical protein